MIRSSGNIKLLQLLSVQALGFVVLTWEHGDSYDVLQPGTCTRREILDFIDDERLKRASLRDSGID
jgi:hypothetical protein